MTDQPNVFTAVNVHRADTIDATYMTGSGGGEWTDLVIGNLRVTIHGPHAKTASMLVAAAGECPEPLPGVWETREPCTSCDAVSAG